MKQLACVGWLLAGLLFMYAGAPGLAAGATGDPLQGHVLYHSSGATYLYHAGVKYAVGVADIGDTLIDAIPAASSAQWDALFGLSVRQPGVPSRNPDPFPASS
jgi:hypothetical protein